MTCKKEISTIIFFVVILSVGVGAVSLPQGISEQNGIGVGVVSLPHIVSEQKTVESRLAFEGTVAIELKKAQLVPGEMLSAEITVVNTGDISISDAYLVVELVSGEERYYPSQLSNMDNIFVEEKVENINLPAHRKQVILFEQVLPEDLRPGRYRLDSYFKTKRAPIQGVPFVFMGATSASFTVKPVSGKKAFPFAKIIRTKTAFNGSSGPVGPTVEPGANIFGSVFVKNTLQTETLHNLTLSVIVCNWDDTSCKTVDVEKRVDIEEIGAGQEKEIAINFVAPEKPSAYAIRIVVADEDKRVLSIYRSRIVVAGATKRIRKLFAYSHYYSAGERVDLNSIVGPSPDRNSPTLEGAELLFRVINNKTKKEIFNKSVPLEDTNGFVEKSVHFTSPAELNNFELCGKIIKDNETIDEACVNYNALLFAENQQGNLKVTWEYDEKTKMLELMFCSTTPERIQKMVDAEYILQEKTGKNTIVSGQLQGTGCITETIENVETKKYVLFFTDHTAKKQKTEEIALVESVTRDCKKITCDDKDPCTKNACKNGTCIYTKIPRCQSKQGSGVPLDLFPAIILGELLVIGLLIYIVRKGLAKQPF